MAEDDKNQQFQASFASMDASLYLSAMGEAGFGSTTTGASSTTGRGAPGSPLRGPWQGDDPAATVALERETETLLRVSKELEERTRALGLGVPGWGAPGPGGERRNRERPSAGGGDEEPARSPAAPATPLGALPTLDEGAENLDGSLAESVEPASSRGGAGGGEVDELETLWMRGGADDEDDEDGGGDGPRELADSEELPVDGPVIRPPVSGGDGEGGGAPLGGIVRERVAGWEAHRETMERRRRASESHVPSGGGPPAPVGIAQRLVADAPDAPCPEAPLGALPAPAVRRDASSGTYSSGSSSSGSDDDDEEDEEEGEGGAAERGDPASGGPRTEPAADVDPRSGAGRGWMTAPETRELAWGGVPDLFPVGAVFGAAPPHRSALGVMSASARGVRARRGVVTRAIACALRPDAEAGEVRDSLECFLLGRGLRVTVREATRVHAVVPAPGGGGGGAGGGGGSGSPLPDAAVLLRALLDLGVSSARPARPTRSGGAAPAADEGDAADGAFWAQQRGRKGASPRRAVRQTSDGFPMASLAQAGADAPDPEPAGVPAARPREGGTSRGSRGRRRRRDPLGALAAQKRRARAGADPSDVDVWLEGGSSLVLSRPGPEAQHAVSPEVAAAAVARAGAEGPYAAAAAAAATEARRSAAERAAADSATARGAVGMRAPWAVADAPQVAGGGAWLLLVSAAVGVEAAEPHAYLAVLTVTVDASAVRQLAGGDAALSAERMEGIAGSLLAAMRASLSEDSLLPSALAAVAAPRAHRPLAESYKAFLRGAVHERTARELRAQLEPLEEAARAEERACAEVLAALSGAFAAAGMRLSPPARAPSLSALPLQPDGPCPRLGEAFLARCRRGQVPAAVQDDAVRRVLVARTVWDLRAELQRKNRQVGLRLSRVRAHLRRVVHSLAADPRAVESPPSTEFRRFFDGAAGTGGAELAREVVLYEASCALGASLGRAYLTWRRAAFGASLLGFRTRRSWPWSEVRAVETAPLPVGVGDSLVLHLVGGGTATLAFALGGRRAYLLASLLLRMHRAGADEDADAELAEAELEAMVGSGAAPAPGATRRPPAAAAAGAGARPAAAAAADNGVVAPPPRAGGNAHGLPVGRRLRVIGEDGRPVRMVVTERGLEPLAGPARSSSAREGEAEGGASDARAWAGAGEGALSQAVENDASSGGGGDGGGGSLAAVGQVEDEDEDEGGDGDIGWEAPDMGSFLVDEAAPVRFALPQGAAPEAAGREVGVHLGPHVPGEEGEAGSAGYSGGTHSDLGEGPRADPPRPRRLSSDEPAPVSASTVVPWEARATHSPPIVPDVAEAEEKDTGAEAGAGADSSGDVGGDGSLPLSPQRPAAVGAGAEGGRQGADGDGAGAGHGAGKKRRKGKAKGRKGSSR